MGWLSIVCITIFVIFCGRYAFKHESLDHLFAGKPADRVFSAMVLAGGVAFAFAAIGAKDSDTEQKNTHQKYCKAIKNGYICKFPEFHEQPEQDTCASPMGRFSDC